MSEGDRSLVGCLICGKDYPLEDMYRWGIYHACEDCNQQHKEKWFEEPEKVSPK